MHIALIKLLPTEWLRQQVVILLSSRSFEFRCDYLLNFFYHTCTLTCRDTFAHSVTQFIRDVLKFLKILVIANCFPFFLLILNGIFFR